MSFENYRKDLPLLVECGLIAIKQGDEESAKKLFNAASILDPANSVSRLGFGLIALHKLELPQARSSFEEIVKAEPDNQRAKAFLSLAHLLTALREKLNNDEKKKFLEKSVSLAQEVLDKTDNPSTRDLAQSILNWEIDIQLKGPALKA